MLAGDSLAGITPDLDSTSDTGYLDADDLTSTAVLSAAGVTALKVNVTIPGSVTLNSGDSIELLRNGTRVGFETASLGLNTFSNVPLPSADGTYSYTARLWDSAATKPAAGTASTALAVTIDNTAPDVSLITTPGNQTYISKQNVDFTLSFNEPILVIGTPSLPLTIGSGATSASAPDLLQNADAFGNSATSPSSTALFRHVVGISPAESTDANGVVINGVLTTTTGTDDVTDKAGNGVNTAITANLLTTANNAMAFGVLVNVNPTAQATWYDPSGAPITSPTTPVGMLPPRVTPLPTLTIKFTDPTSGLPVAQPFSVTPPGSPPSPPFGSGTLTVDDFRLTLNGSVVSDLASRGVVLTCPVAGPDAFATFQLAGLENVTDAPGAYTLTFSDLALGTSCVVSWVKDYATPGELRATFTPFPVAPNGVTANPIDRIDIRFTDAAGAANGIDDPTDARVPVTGVITNGPPDTTQFALYKNGALQTLLNASPVAVTGSNSSYTISGLSSLTSGEGSYELVLLSGNTIRSLSDSDTNPAGSTLKAPQSYQWQNSQAPTIDVTSTTTTLLTGNTATITFTLSKATANFLASDVQVTNGTLLNFTKTANPLVYTATFTPTINTTGVGTVTVPAGVFTDASGNANIAGSVSLRIDTDVPTLTGITAPSGIYRVGQTIVFTAKFTEDVSVVGMPSLNVFIGTGASESLRSAIYAAGSGTDTLTFHYTIATNDANDVDGIRVQQIVLPAGASIQDEVGNNAILHIASPVISNTVFVMPKVATASFTLLPSAVLSPRATPVSVIKVVFDNPVPYVNNVDSPGYLSLADFELTQNGKVVAFPPSARLTQSAGYTEFEISNLSTLTEPVGTYILTFSDAQIGDRVSTTWVKTASTPGELTASITLAPTSLVPRKTPVDTATIAFSQQVLNVDINDFVFRKNNVIVPWSSTSAVLSGSGDTYVISGLTTLTNDPGSTYEITLLSDVPTTPTVESDVVTLAGGTLIAPVSVRWTFEPPVAIVSVTPVAVPLSGYFRVGDVMEFSVKFSEKVFVTNPQFLTMPILLGTGTATKTVQAGYVRGDATDTLVFRYQPQPDDQDLDGILLTGTLSLGTGTNVGTVKDSAGIDAVLAYTQPNTTSLRVDSKSPQVTAVTLPANRTYGLGESLIFTVSFDEAVTFTGTPRIPLVIGTRTVYADAIAGQETPTLIFQYVIQNGDIDTDGIVASNQIALNGGTATDIAGNPAILTFPSIPNLGNVRVDTVPPAAPVILGVVADNTGADVVIPVGGSTRDNTLKVVGTAEPGSTVSVFVDGSIYGTVVVPASGNWEFTTFTLASKLPTGNAYSFTAKATDALNNEGPLSSAYTVTVDTTPPTAPTVNPLVTLNPRPTLTGTADLLAGETLTVTIVTDPVSNVSVTYPVTPDSAGNWTLDLSTVVPTFLPLLEGTYSVTATVTDAADNATIDGSTSELKIDTSPVTVALLQTNKPRPTITGTAVIPTGGRLEVTVNGQTYTVVPAADGTWSLDLAMATPAFVALADGVYPVTATVFDASGISISDPTSNELQIDTTGPSVVSVDSLTADGFYRAGAVISIQIRFNDAVTVDTKVGLPLIALNTGRNAVYDPAASTATVLTFIYRVQAGDNIADLDYATPSSLVLNGATIRDAADNDASLGLALPGTSGSLGFNRSITIDTTAPSPAPTVTPLTTTNTLPTITGTATLATGERLQVTVNGTTYDVLTDIAGRWSVDLALANPVAGSPQLQPLTSGLRYNVVATVLDAAGNATSDATANELSINTVAPIIIGAQDDAAPVVTTIGSGASTNDPTPTLLGSAEPNALITVSATIAGGTAVVIGTTNSDSQGNWTFTPSSNLAAGTYSFTVESLAVGGTTPVKSVIAFTLTIDTAAPTIGSVTVPAGLYRAGQTVPFTVSFSEAVFVVGAPTLNVLIGTGTAAIARTATYVAGSGTRDLVFLYTLQATDNNDVDGVQVVSLTLPTTGDTIRDAAANDALLALTNGVVPGNVFLMPKVATPTFTLFPSARTNPRATPVSVIRVMFDNPVPFVATTAAPNGVDATGQLSLADFEFTRNGNVIGLPLVARLIPDSGNMEFEISNLSGITEEIGTYIVTFADMQIGPFKQLTWSKTESTPVPLTATVTLAPASGSSPRVTPVDSVAVEFSEKVDNVDLTDFVLRMDGVVVPWTGSSAVLSATGTGATYTITGLTGITSTRATYELKLRVSDISSYTGGQLINDVATAWTYAGASRILAGGVTAPTTPASGFFKKGEVMTFTVRFSDPVFIPNPAGVALPIQIGTRSVSAAYTNGAGTTLLTFRYTVQPGDEDRDGILLTGTITAPFGAIKDSTGANAELSYSPPDTSYVFVDAISPTLTGVTPPAARRYDSGSALSFLATFSEPMVVSGTPRIALTVGNTTRYANYVAGGETSVLVFEYSPQSGDLDTNGIVASTTISLNGGSITDLAGNTGGLTFAPLITTGVLVVDTTPPAAPAIVSVVDNVGPIAGLVPANGITNDLTPTVTGTAEPFSVVTLKTGSTVLGSTTTDSGGNWSIVATKRSEGNYLISLTASATDAAGNAGPASPAYPISIDTTGPSAPTFKPFAGKTVSGKADPGASVTLQQGTTFVGTATVNADGDWSLPVSLASGTYTLTAFATDQVGNDGASAFVSVTIDDVAPSAPVITGVIDNSDLLTGLIANGGLTNDPTPTVSGTAEPGCIVTLLWGEKNLGSTTVNSQGDWSITAAQLASGTHALTATATDPSGNTSEASLPYTVVIDATPPQAPSISSVIDDVIPMSGNVIRGGSTNDATPTVTGSADPGALVSLKSGSTVLGTATADSFGLWSITSANLVDGPYTLVVSVVDAAGNVANSPSFPLTVDTVAPAIPVIIGVESDEPPAIGPVLNGSLTNDRQLRVNGTAEPNSRVTFWTDYGTPSAVNIVTRADASGRWSVTTPLLPEGQHAFTALVRDAASNRSGFSTASLVRVDTEAPRIIAVASSLPSGTYGAGQTVDIQVRFTEPVLVTGTPALTLNTSPARIATFIGSTGDTATFRYVASVGDVATRLDAAGPSAIALNRGEFRDQAGNIANLSLPLPGAPGSLSSSTAIAIDGAIKVAAGMLTTAPETAPQITRSRTAIPITFNTPVTGLTLASIKLFYENRSVSLAGATLTGSGTSYTLTMPSQATTSLKGLYRLRIGGMNAGIMAAGNVPLNSPVSFYWKRI